MNLALAILSFFSAIMLPGAILYRFFLKENFNITSFIVSSFIFSLCFNFILISSLILVGIYIQNIIISIIVIEWILFIYLFKYEIINGIQLPKLPESSAKIAFTISLLLSLYMLNKVFNVDIFYAWDAVVSWNRWASELANGKFIMNDGGYPQLFPMLLSLGYVASGKISSFQGIGVAIWNYFAFVGIICSSFLITKDTKDPTKWINFGLIISVISYLSFFQLSNQFFVGYVDMPVAMVILISLILILKSNICLNENDNKNVHMYLILSAFCAGISTEIKQAGLFYICVYAICLFYLYFKYKINNKIILICIAIVVLFTLPWIIIALYKKIILNTEMTNASYTMNAIYGDISPIKRLIKASNTSYSILFLIGGIAIFAKNKLFSIISILSILYFIFWGCFLSYDLRNLQAGIPLMIISLSYVIWYHKNNLKMIYQLICKRITTIFPIFVLLGVFVGQFYQDKILIGEYKRKMTLGGKEINKIIFNTYKTRGNKILLTSNQLIAYTPEFDSKYHKLYHFGAAVKEGEFEKYATDLKSKIGAFYILIPTIEFERYKDFLKNTIKLGDDGSYVFLEF